MAGTKRCCNFGADHSAAVERRTRFLLSSAPSSSYAGGWGRGGGGLVMLYSGTAVSPLFPLPAEPSEAVGCPRERGGGGCPEEGGTCRVSAELQLAAPLGAAGGAAGSALAGCLQEPGATECHLHRTPLSSPRTPREVHPTP